MVPAVHLEATAT